MKTRAQQILLVCCLVTFLTGCTTSTTAWEYRTRTTDNPKGKAVLDGYGKNGWELVSCTTRPKDDTGTNFVYQYVFKRPKK